jgi:hypothetical protein
MALEMKGTGNYRNVTSMLMHLKQWITWNIIKMDWFFIVVFYVQMWNQTRTFLADALSVLPDVWRR